MPSVFAGNSVLSLKMVERGFDEATRALSGYIVPGRSGQASATLDDVGRMCTMLGVDLGKLSAIHIAGTKGKGSTSALTERLLRAGGQRTGLFTSPHLVDVRERVRINGRVLTKAAFARYFWHVHDVVQAAIAEGTAHIHYFHFLTVLGFYIFQEEHVDVAVIEVGLGGRLDSTNVLPRPVVCGVTILDLDHVAILGNTLTLIAAEKAGIIKGKIPAVTTALQPEEALGVLASHAKAVGAPLFLAPPLSAYDTAGGAVQLGMQGHFQQHNAALAVALVRIWSARCLASNLATASNQGILKAPPHTSANEWPVLCESAWAAASKQAAAPWIPSAVAVPPVSAEALAGRPALLPSRVAAAAENAAAVVAGPAHPGLSESERNALASARWPARAQVLEGVDGGSVDIGQVRVHLDGAHTPTSLLAAAQWFAQASKTGGERVLRVLVFNTTGGRSGTELLRPLVDPELWGGEGLGTGRQRLCDVALFVPNDSSLDALPAGAAGGEAGGFEWQGKLLEEWLRLDLQVWKGGGLGGSLDLTPATQSQAEAVVVAAGEELARAEVPRRLVTPRARVVDSIEGALKAVAAADAALGGAKIHLLCTGSLYLAGDVLKHLCADSCLDL